MRRITAYTGGAVATAYPVTMISVICIVKATRSQNPAPNHCALCDIDPLTAALATKTIPTATSASANASGNHRSNQSDRRRPMAASRDEDGGSCTSMGPRIILTRLPRLWNKARPTLNQMANLGYVGLGGMGSRMAARLIDKGHTVTGYNRTRAKAQSLIEQGMRWADSPKAVAHVTDVMFVNVADSDSLEAVADGPDGFVAGLGASKVVIDMSTVSPAVSCSVAERVRCTGADMVDAPVSGSQVSLEQGKLAVMVGGTRATFDRILPILHDIGPRVTYVGVNGKGL